MSYDVGYGSIVRDTTIDARSGANAGRAIANGRETTTGRKSASGATRERTRLTVTYDDPRELQEILAKYADAIGKYDVLALEPRGERAFASACANKHADVVSVRASERLSYKFTNAAMASARENEIFFELCYADALRDSQSRRNFFANASALARATRGGRERVVLSSGATKPLEIRSMYDVVNLATFFGMTEGNARAAMTDNVERMLALSERRRNVDFSASTVERAETT